MNGAFNVGALTTPPPPHPHTRIPRVNATVLHDNDDGGPAGRLRSWTAGEVQVQVEVQVQWWRWRGGGGGAAGARCARDARRGL